LNLLSPRACGRISRSGKLRPQPHIEIVQSHMHINWLIRGSGDVYSLRLDGLEPPRLKGETSQCSRLRASKLWLPQVPLSPLPQLAAPLMARLALQGAWVVLHQSRAELRIDFARVTRMPNVCYGSKADV